MTPFKLPGGGLLYELGLGLSSARAGEIQLARPEAENWKLMHAWFRKGPWLRPDNVPVWNEFRNRLGGGSHANAGNSATLPISRQLGCIRRLAVTGEGPNSLRG